MAFCKTDLSELQQSVIDFSGSINIDLEVDSGGLRICKWLFLKNIYQGYLYLSFGLKESDWLFKSIIHFANRKARGLSGKSLGGELLSHCYFHISVALFRSHKHLPEVTNPIPILITTDLKICYRCL